MAPGPERLLAGLPETTPRALRPQGCLEETRGTGEKAAAAGQDVEALVWGGTTSQATWSGGAEPQGDGDACWGRPAAGRGKWPQGAGDGHGTPGRNGPPKRGGGRCPVGKPLGVSVQPLQTTLW